MSSACVCHIENEACWWCELGIAQKKIDEQEKTINKSASVMAELMFAFMGKDEDFPHSFEINVFEEALLYLQEHYMGEKFNLSSFEDHLNQMNRSAHKN